MPPPPTTMTRPSGSALLPPHDGSANRSGMLVKVFVVGFHTTAVSPLAAIPPGQDVAIRQLLSVHRDDGPVELAAPLTGLIRATGGLSRAAA